MHHLKKINIKIGIIICSFSLLLATFFSATLWILASRKESQFVADDEIYFISENELTQILENDGNLSVNPNNLMKEKEYQSQLFDDVISSIIPIACLFFPILFILSSGLWIVLKKAQIKETTRLIGEFNSAIKDTITSHDPALNTAYKFLKSTFDKQLHDYKRLSSYLSHEQKNAIAILRTNVELTGSTEYLKNIDRIADNIDDILTLSENEEMSALVKVDVSLLCAEVCDNYNKFRKNIIFEFDEDDNTEILARPRWIYRAVANVIDNAIKYGDEKPISILVNVAKGSVIIRVTDHGIGIEKAKQEKIFDNHFRINELNKDGYGIGLSLVSHVCDLCGGVVVADSEIGKGSTFYLSFPQASL